jgi:hypothetical protein
MRGEHMENLLAELYHLYKPCVVRITVKNSYGDLATGVGFHIGDGYILTARHVIESKEIEEIAPHHYTAKNISAKQRFYPSDSKIDLAVLHTDFSLAHYMEFVTILREEGGTPAQKIDFIPFGDHLNDWLGDELLMTKVLIMGFPVIPLSSRPELVAVEGEVSAIIDKYSGPHPHFILSSIPRGGFSGGPVISERGILLVPFPVRQFRVVRV